MSILQHFAQKRKDHTEIYKMKTSASNGTICSDGAIPYLSSIMEESTATTDFTERAPIPKDCSMIMNGHYKMPTGPETKEDGHEEYCAGEEARPFLNGKRAKIPPKPKTHNYVTESRAKPCSRSGMVSLVPRKDSSGEDSSEESGDDSAGGEPERHLLKNGNEQEGEASPKFKLTGFKPSPKKTSDTRTHIQHRPLGLQPSPAYSLQESSYKWKWNLMKCMGSAMLTFLACLFVSVMVFVLATGPIQCQPERNWWEDVVSYEIFPASFQDTDNDGFGDLRGVVVRADYIKNLSVDVVRLNSIFSALDYPLEYEHVIDFANVDPHLGRLGDFQDLVTALHSRGMFLILDMNPTVTSDQHTWAAHWLLHRSGRYEDFYVNFTDDKAEPPMESRSIQSVYLKKDRASPHRTFGSHIYLNWSNSFVQEEMLDVLRFWLAMGVDGFYMKYLEDMKVEDDADMAAILSGWREVLDSFSVNTTRKILAGSLKTLQTLQEKFGPSETMASAFDVIDAGIYFSIGDVTTVSQELARIRKWVGGFQNPPWIWWHFGNVETSRLASRIGEKYTMNSIFVLTLLPGTVSVFYGDEIGLRDTYEVSSNKVYKGGQLTLMQWTSSSNGNFTHDNVKPWLPIHPDLQRANFKTRSRNVSLLSRLLYLKKSTLQQATREKSPFRSLVRKIDSRLEPDQPSYHWSRDTSNDLLILEVTRKGKTLALLVSNFGKTVVPLDSVPYLVETEPFNLHFHPLSLVFTTDSFSPVETRKGHLHPGHSVLCLYSR